MQHCEILPAKIAKLLPLLARLNEQLSIRDQLPQIEVAVGDHVDVLVLRIMQALSPADEQLLRQFADEHQVQFWTQTKGPDTVHPFYPLNAPALTYSMPEFDITMPYAPTEFTQVNSTMNRLMVSRAIRLLALARTSASPTFSVVWATSHCPSRVAGRKCSASRGVPHW